ncbi:hypothetical protein OAL98_02265 [Gammaproteobacteria bacterium]|nr:hypothetical protein [Gammaproteobacteria bacterium]
MFKNLNSLFILFILVSCSLENDEINNKSSSLIKPNFSSSQSRHDCILYKDKSLNSLEAFIPNFVNKAEDLLPSATLEFLFNQEKNIDNFSILYLDNQANFNVSTLSQILSEEGIDDVASCQLRDEIMLSSDIFIDNISINFTSFEVEFLNCEFNEGFNFGTFAIEVDTFLNLVRKKDVKYFAKFQQINNESNNFTWINYLSSAEEKDTLYEGWLEEEDSIKIQESFNAQSLCKSSASYKGYKVL